MLQPDPFAGRARIADRFCRMLAQNLIGDDGGAEH